MLEMGAEEESETLFDSYYLSTKYLLSKDPFMLHVFSCISGFDLHAVGCAVFLGSNIELPCWPHSIVPL